MDAGREEYAPAASTRRATRRSHVGIEDGISFLDRRSDWALHLNPSASSAHASRLSQNGRQVKQQEEGPASSGSTGVEYVLQRMLIHAQGASKKRKLSKDDIDPKKPSTKPKAKAKGKEKAADRGTIPVPTVDDDVDLSDVDLEAFEEFGDAIGFLSKLDEKGITRCVLFTVH